MKKSYLFSLLICLSTVTYHSSAQTSTFENNKWSGFFDQEKFNQNFEDKTASLLLNEQFINPQDAANKLIEVEGLKIKLNKPKTRTKALSSAEIASIIQPSFVAFGVAYDCGNCHKTHINPASGYIISEDGLIVTNYHVIESYTKTSDNKNLAMTVQGIDGEVYLVTEVISSYKAADLAIVKIDTKGKKLKALPLGNTANVGDDVFVISNPAPMINYFTVGKVARNYLGYFNSKEKLPQTDITADYAAGSSGAPIVDQYGNVVSTVSATRSIYYNPKEQKNLQMVAKNTIPVVLLKELIAN
ncbi:S1 family peptidase [Sphingobacterium sp. HJSM2_6]|uniref:S1 family peptidase n=1 Tax=Sphingobacterium sp. HJSM2_6 TaxID=3366264 RepID=UPI003BEAEE8B